MSTSSTTPSSTLPHLFLIGSTGRTGRLVIAEALNRGHTITALARDPRSLDTLIAELPEPQRSRINVVKGDPTSESDLRSALTITVTHVSSSSRPIVIISTLGQTRKSGNPWAATTSPPMFMTHAAEALFAALGNLPASSKVQFRKVVFMSMFGVEESFANLHPLIKPVMWYSNMWQTVEDHNALDAVVRGQEEMEYVLVRPTMLKEGERKAVKVLGENGKGNSCLIPSGITVKSVVSFLLDASVSEKWNGKTPVIVN